VFTITQATNYTWLLANQALVGHASFDSNTLGILEVIPGTFNPILNNANTSTYEKLDRKDCIDNYTPSGFGARGNLVIVMDDSNSTGQLYAWGSVDFSEAGGISSCCDDNYDSLPPGHPPVGGLSYSVAIGEWLCSKDPYKVASTGSCEYNKIDPSTWELHGHNVDYCLSQRVPEECAISFVPSIVTAVLICNFLKVMVALYIMTSRRRSIYECLCSVGDAVASFLQSPDFHRSPLTIQMSPSDAEQQAWMKSKKIDDKSTTGHTQPRRRWREAVPGVVWI